MKWQQLKANLFSHKWHADTEILILVLVNGGKKKLRWFNYVGLSKTTLADENVIISMLLLGWAYSSTISYKECFGKKF